jgi:hypothetical protein
LPVADHQRTQQQPADDIGDCFQAKRFEQRHQPNQPRNTENRLIDAPAYWAAARSKTVSCAGWDTLANSKLEEK